MNNKSDLDKFKMCECRQCKISFKTYKWRKTQTFCSKSCATRYRNSHKTKGSSVSRLQLYIHKRLYEQFPCIKFVFNQVFTSIQRQLDIYIPKLNTAIQINGAFHYKSIFGDDALFEIQNRDKEKAIKCKQIGLNLFIINSSKMKDITKDKINAQSYFQQVKSIIDSLYIRDKYQEQIVVTQQEYNKNVYGTRLPKHKKTCKCCNKQFRTGRIKLEFCSRNCAQRKFYLFNPTREQLISLLNKNKITTIAKNNKVTRSCIDNLITKYNIDRQQIYLSRLPDKQTFKQQLQTLSLLQISKKYKKAKSVICFWKNKLNLT